jgi:phosphomevalonate kinase
MNKIKKFGAIGLLLVGVSTMVEVKAYHDPSFFIIEQMFKDLRDKILEQRNLLKEQHDLITERDEHIAKITKILEEQKELIDNYIFNRGYDK